MITSLLSIGLVTEDFFWWTLQQDVVPEDKRLLGISEGKLTMDTASARTCFLTWCFHLKTGDGA